MNALKRRTDRTMHTEKLETNDFIPHTISLVLMLVIVLINVHFC